MAYINDYTTGRQGQQHLGGSEEYPGVSERGTTTAMNVEGGVRKSSSVLADMTRIDMMDFEQRLAPRIEQAYDQVLDPARRAELGNEALGIADDAAEGAIERQQGRTQMMRSRLNVVASERQQESEARLGAVARQNSRASLRNQTRRGLEDRENKLLGGY